ncbi:MAG: HD domain-containing protein [Geobacteraceae bacterium]|nr:HD domain-containing protein [Geobacteraceae bacterium]
MDLTTRYRNALTLAFDVHAGDFRKGKAVPYISHLMSVSALVLEHGGSEDEAIAALLLRPTATHIRPAPGCAVPAYAVAVQRGAQQD